MTRWRMTALAAAASMSLALAGCGGDDPDSSAPTPSVTSTATSVTSGDAGTSSAAGSPTAAPTTALPPPTSTTTASPQFIKAVAQGMFKKARKAPTWSMTRKQSTCVAKGLVSTFGTDRLVSWGLSQESAGTRTIEELGMDEPETGAFVDTLMTCGVITPARLVSSTKESLGKDAEDPTLSACLDKTIDDALVRALTIDQFLGDVENSDSFAQYQQTLLDCVS